MSMRLLKKKKLIWKIYKNLFYNSLCQQDDNKSYMLGQIIISHIADQGLMSKICKDLSKMQSNRKGKKA